MSLDIVTYIYESALLGNQNFNAVGLFNSELKYRRIFIYVSHKKFFIPYIELIDIPSFMESFPIGICYVEISRSVQQLMGQKVL